MASSFQFIGKSHRRIACPSWRRTRLRSQLRRRVWHTCLWAAPHAAAHIVGYPSHIDAVGSSTLAKSQFEGAPPGHGAGTGEYEMPDILETLAGLIGTNWKRRDADRRHSRTFFCCCGNHVFFRNSLCLSCEARSDICPATRHWCRSPPARSPAPGSRTTVERR